ncbi:MAG TPA: hypothetical protein VHY91_07250 [Pirellulales bacterium]|jgi:hypothetical protein|nr:hypothetical protein [Pirellulales bacterium]
MNGSPFWPLVWKEYRAGRAFWLAMVAVALVIQGSLCWGAKATPQRNWELYATALFIAAGLMVGVGATMFAVEREEQTFGFVRRLPVRAWQLALPKLLCALVGWGACVALLWLAAGAMAAWQFPSGRDAGQLWIQWGVAALECLAWGIFFSLLLTSPLKAAALTMLGVLAVNFGLLMPSSQPYRGLASHVAMVPWRLALLVLMMAVDAWLLPRWLTDRVPRPAINWGWARGRAMPAKRTVGWFCADYWPPLGHLIWQAWRELAGNWWALAFVAWALLSAESITSRLRYFNAPAGTSMLLTLAVAIYGSLVFHADQVRGPRFLAERGVSARLVWLSRQIVSLAVLAAVTITVAGLAMALHVWSNPLSALLELEPADQPTLQWATPGSSLATFMLAVYAAGQVASLFVRRSLLAGVAAGALGLFVASWTHLMWALGIAWWWTVLPLVAGCFAATWLRAPDWLLERPGWRGWIAPAAALALPTTAVLGAVCCFRVYQIPDPTPKPIDWGNLWHKALPLKSTDPIDAVARGVEKRELYDKAFVLLRKFDAPKDVKQITDGTNAADDKSAEDQPNRQAFVDLMLAASRLDGPFWAKSWSEGRAVAAQLITGARHLIVIAEKETQAGNLDRALDVYFTVMRTDIDAALWGGLWPGRQGTDRPEFPALRPLIQWAAAPGQTAERVQQAVRRLQEFHAALPRPESLVDALFEVTPGRVAQCFDDRAHFRYMPWERARALRLVRLLTYDEIMKLNHIDAALEVGAPTGDPILGTGSQFERERRSNRMAELQGTTLCISDCGIAHAEPITAVLQFETDYRATLIILAVEAWKLAHGHLPAHLDDVLGGELHDLPVEPTSGEPFGYFPDGFPAVPNRWPDKPAIPKAFLWSTAGVYSRENLEQQWWWRPQLKLQAYFIPR